MQSRFFMVAAACLLWAGVALAQVNINTATREELDALKGIGEARANAIIKYRQEHGPFKSVSELKNIPNFPDSLVGKLGKKITVGGTANSPAAPARERPAKGPAAVPAERMPPSLTREVARPASPAMPARPAFDSPAAPAAPAVPAIVKPAAPMVPAASPKSGVSARPAMPGKPAVPAASREAPAVPDVAPAHPASPAAPAVPAQPARPARPAGLN